MRKRCPSLIILCSLILNVTRADDTPALFQIRQNGKFGYINAAGGIAIAPRFLRSGSEEGRHFSEGLQAVQVGDKSGYIDTSGKLVIEPRFSGASSFAEGLAAVRFTEAPFKWGYIDRTGRIVIPQQFDDANVFSDGLALVIVDGKAGYINKSGTFIVVPQSRSYSPQHSTFSEGLACIELNGRWGFIDKQGKIAIKAQSGEPSSFHDGLAVVKMGTESSPRWGFINQTGAPAIEPRFSLAWQFSEGLARVREDKRPMAFIDQTGKIVFTVAEGRRAGEFSEGLVNVRVGAGHLQEKWGYVDRRGKWTVEPRFQAAEPFYQGLARVVTDHKIAYINQKGHFVWGPDSGNEALAAKFRTQASPEEWRKNREEWLRLASLIDPTNPPLTESLLKSAEVPAEALQRLAEGGSGNAKQLLERLLSYTPDPALVELLPDMAARQQSTIQTEVARALVAIGDPFVLPALRTWLNDALKAEGTLDVVSRTTLGCALEGLKQFRDEASLSALQDLLKSPDLVPGIREAALAAIAELGLPLSKPTLLDALQDERLGGPIRCAAAAVLVRLGESAGRGFLLASYDLYLDSLRKTSSGEGYSRAELQFLGDAELITSLKTKADAEPPGVPKNNISTLLDAMRVSAMSVEELKVIAAKHGDRDLDLRLHAIGVISRQGKADLVPFLESLRAAPDDYARSDWNGLRRQAAAAAARQIRMRHWQQFP
ncbi:MAG: WG repeat-containing protein [Verrucomicrobiota bacterium]